MLEAFLEFINTFTAMTYICPKSKFSDFSHVCSSGHFSVEDRISNKLGFEKSEAYCSKKVCNFPLRSKLTE